MRDEQLLHSENGIDGSTPLSQVGVTTSPHVNILIFFFLYCFVTGYVEQNLVFKVCSFVGNSDRVGLRF